MGALSSFNVATQDWRMLTERHTGGTAGHGKWIRKWEMDLSHDSNGRKWIFPMTATTVKSEFPDLSPPFPMIERSISRSFPSISHDSNGCNQCLIAIMWSLPKSSTTKNPLTVLITLGFTPTTTLVIQLNGQGIQPSSCRCRKRSKWIHWTRSKCGRMKKGRNLITHKVENGREEYNSGSLIEATSKLTFWVVIFL